MKLSVLRNNRDGTIIGTVRNDPSHREVHVMIHADKGQTVHHIDVAEDFAHLNGDEMHKRVKALLKKRPSTATTRAKAKARKR